jgi:hypothetical protein
MTSTVAANRPALAAARAFYCEALGGRRIRRPTLCDDRGVLCFRVGTHLVTTGPAAKGRRITLVVDDAVAIAERCWDAGFTVRIRDSTDATTIAVIDPFALELALLTPSPRSHPASVDDSGSTRFSPHRARRVMIRTRRMRRRL